MCPRLKEVENFTKAPTNQDLTVLDKSTEKKIKMSCLLMKLKNRELRNRMENLAEATELLNKETEKKNYKIESVNNELRKKDNIIKELGSINKDLEEKYKNFKIIFGELEPADIRLAFLKIKKYEKIIMKRETQCENITYSSEETYEEIARLNALVKELEEANSKLKESYNVQVYRRKGLQEEVTRLEEELNILAVKSKELELLDTWRETRLSNLLTEQNELLTKISSLKVANEKLIKINKNHGMKKGELINKNNEVNNISIESKNIENSDEISISYIYENEKLSKEKETVLSVKVDKLSPDVKEKGNLEDLEEAIRIFKNEIKKLLEEKLLQHKELKKTLEEICSTQRNTINSEQHGRKENIAEKTELLNKERENNYARIEEQNKMLQKLDSIIKEMDAMNTYLKQKYENLKIIFGNLEIADTHLTLLKIKNYEKGVVKQDKCENVIDNLPESYEEVPRLNALVKELEEINLKLKEFYDLQIQTAETLEEKISKLEEEFTIKSKGRVGSDKCQDYRQKLLFMESEYERINKSFKKEKRNSESLEKAVNKLKNEIIKLEEDKNLTAEKLEQKEKELQELNAKYQELSSAHRKVINVKLNEARNIHEMIDVLNNQLDSLGTRFASKIENDKIPQLEAIISEQRNWRNLEKKSSTSTSMTEANEKSSTPESCSIETNLEERKSDSKKAKQTNYKPSPEGNGHRNRNNWSEYSNDSCHEDSKAESKVPSSQKLETRKPIMYRKRFKYAVWK